MDAILGCMTGRSRKLVTAVLGPTNTGKTHLAIERMVAHSSGMIGFPLRLLAREVYDRVVKLKGARQVALITGEEKILPPDARWFLCTAESMPIDRDVAFVALDEAQLGADAERGHVFTDRLLHARGREETMLLGSEALRPMIQALVPDAEIIGRPRFSTLSYAGAKKLSRLPKRSVIVAFSAEEVYAVAEMLRRLRGGAAVVMGALSPRTRNAQVEMFQAGEVDYLVATDAIGMGLNMDVAHVAFASLRKFDGHRQRRLTVAEMAQIAGRAGRHQRDGTFGALVDEGPGAFTPDEIDAIEQHRFPRLEQLYWRNGAPETSSIDALIADLEERPADTVLRAAPQALDLDVLKRLADEDWVRARATSPAMVRRLWAACGVPDFRKLGVDSHTRFVSRLFGHLSEGKGHIPHDWFAAEIARLDTVQGDVDTIAGRIAAARSWAYIAHRADWLADPGHWAERTRVLEERLSDALHAALSQRFVDRRSTLLMRQIGADPRALPVTIATDGQVLVEDHAIGRLDGFRFTVAADAGHADKRLLLAAAERRLAGERRQRGQALADAPDRALGLIARPGTPPMIGWQGCPVAVLRSGAVLTRPRIDLDRALDCLDVGLRDRIRARLAAWVADKLARHIPGLLAVEGIAGDAGASPGLRAVAAALVAGAGLVGRVMVASVLDDVDGPARARLRRAGVVVGTLDLFDPRLLKPAAARWRQVLLAAQRGGPLSGAPATAATILARGVTGAEPCFGYRPIGRQAVRIDLVERIARAAHNARDGRNAFAGDPAFARSIGMTDDTLQRLMASLGFRATAGQDDRPHWAWRGLPPRPKAAPPLRDNGFGGLADLVRLHGR
jgi:ATP-dependent RNA helicase SUPV3L1/SUV3